MQVDKKTLFSKFLSIVVAFFLSSTMLYASADEMRKTLLEEFVTYYFEDNPQTKAVEIFQDSANPIFKAYKVEKEFMVFDREIPTELLHLHKVEKHIVIYEQIVAKLVFYEEKDSLLHLSKEELKYLDTKDSLIISNESDWPPYDFAEDGNAKGYSVDLMRLLASKLGKKAKFVTAPWNTLVENFCNGEIDILHPTDTSSKVEECGKISRAIIKDTTNFLTRDNFKPVKNIEDVYGFKMSSPKGWFQTEYFKENFSGKIEVIEAENILEAIEFVRTGKSDFTFDYGNVLKYFIAKNNFTGLRISSAYSISSEFDNLFLAVPKNNEVLLGILNKTFDSLSVAELDKLQTKWFGLHKNAENRFLETLNMKEVECLKAKDELIACVRESYLPYEKGINTKDDTSMDSDYFLELEDFLNIKIKTESYKSDLELVQMLQDEKCDFSMFQYKRKEFADDLLYSSMNSSENLVLLGHKENLFVNSLSDFEKGTKIAVLKELGIASRLQKRYENLDIVEVETYKSGVAMLHDKDVFGFIMELSALQYRLENKSIEDLKIIAKLDETIDFFVVMDKNKEMLHSILDKSFKALDSSFYERVDKKYRSIITKTDTFDYSVLYKVAIVLLFIVLIAFYKQYILTSLNKKLEKKIAKEVEESLSKDNIINQQNKMIAMGEMLENIAHQWRQPLSEINATVLAIDNEMCKQGVHSEIVLSELSNIETLTAHMSNTINDFRDFYSKEKVQKRFDCEATIRKTVAMLEHSLKNNQIQVNIINEIDFKISSYENELQQVFLAIINNAKDAFKTSAIEKKNIKDKNI